MIRKVFAAKLDSLPAVTAMVDEELEKHHCDPATIMKVELSLEEAFVNVANYGYPDSDGLCEVTVSAEDRKMTLILSDSGVAFDPLQQPEPDLLHKGETPKIGGLGIFLIKKQMDEVYYEYRDGQNRLTLIKNF